MQLRRLFLLVSAAVVVDTMFYAAITPLLPDYVATLGISKSAAGVLSASYAAGTFLGALPSGYLAARLGVRPTLLIGLGLTSVSCIVFGFAQEIALLDVARFAQGVGGACTWAGALAWLVAAAPRERRGEMLGGAMAFAIAGALLGPVVGALASELGPELVFSAVAAFSAALAAVALRIDAAAPVPPPGLASVARCMASPGVLAAFWLVALPSVFSGLLNVLAPLRLDELGADGTLIGAVFLVSAGVEALASRSFGRVSDRRGRLAPMRAGLAGSTVAALAITLPETILLLAVAVVVTVVSLATFWAPAMALLSDAAEAGGLDQGFAFALVNLAWAGGQVLGGSAGASLAEATSDAVPYLAAAALFAATLVALTLLSQGRRPRRVA